MPNMKYLTKRVAEAAASQATAQAQTEPEAFLRWARALTDDQLRGAFQVIVEEVARRAHLDPDRLRQLRTVVLTLLH